MDRQFPSESQHSQPGNRKKLCIGYVLSYRDPHYIRSLSLLQVLQRCPDVRVAMAINTHKGLRRYVETWRALRSIRATEAPDVYILGFRGHEIFWPVRWMTRGVPLVFDALMSPYASLHEEGKAGLLGKLFAPLIYRVEKRLLQHADLVLTDTRLHVDYYTRTFALPEAKVCALPVGAIEPEPGQAVNTAINTDPFSVLFYGSFLPLHGIDTIVAAAALLTDLPIRFDFIGGTARQAARLYRQCTQLNVTRYTHRRWVPFEQLLKTDIPHASLCLGGPFGDTPQARRVVTGKTSQCLALSKATVIGRIDEDYGFIDRINCLLTELADANVLADNIRWAYEHRALLPQLGARGHQLYTERLSISAIATRLIPALYRTATKSTA